MPIDPMIALRVNPPPQTQSPVEALGQVLSLKNLVQQGQLGEERLKSARMENTAAEKQAQELKLFEELVAQGAPDDVIAKRAPRFAQKYFDTRAKAQKTAQEKEDRANEEIGNAIFSVYATPQEQRGDFYKQTVDQLVKGGHDPGKFAPAVPDEATLRGLAFRYMKPEKVHQILMAEADERRKQTEEKRKVEEATRKKTEHNLEVEQRKTANRAQKVALATQGYARVSDEASFQNWLSGLDEDTKKFMQPPAKFEAKFGEKVEAMGMTASQRVTSEETNRHNKAIEAARKSDAEGKGGNPKLVQAVLSNPQLFDRLTPSAIVEIAPELHEGGFKFPGKPLSESAKTKISESRSSLASLRDLRQTLLDNEQYIGPLAGLQAINPYSEGRKAQAKIDLVKQRVGKTLEGGVLRKEDEEKYKKILATLTDTPSTAIAKVDGLLETIQRDLDIFVEEQQLSGKEVKRPASESKPTLPTKGPLLPTSTVKLRAPNGDVREVSADQAEHYIKLGAKRVN